jgi:short-chain fatty acids transporter
VSQTALRKPVGEEEEPTGFLARFALSLTEWTERWVPDAFIFALIGTILDVGAALAVTPATTGQVIDAWGAVSGS